MIWISRRVRGKAGHSVIVQFSFLIHFTIFNLPYRSFRTIPFFTMKTIAMLMTFATYVSAVPSVGTDQKLPYEEKRNDEIEKMNFPYGDEHGMTGSDRSEEFKEDDFHM